MSLFMGIDGGGSTLRVAIIDEHATIVAEVKQGTANPNLIGRDVAAAHIQAAMRDVLLQVDGTIDGVGIGIAGASAVYANDWLHGIIRDVLPSCHIAAASDNEIALVGALGKRHGILILAGTGSGVFGVNAAGDSAQVGGWGYLLGDEGSGYWMGLQALKNVADAFDRAEESPFTEVIAETLGVTSPRHLIESVYLSEQPIPTIANLAPIVLQLADEGMSEAQTITSQASAALVAQAQTAMTRLQMNDPQIAFAGSIVTHDNPVSRGVCAALGLSERPQALYRPVIGAALLAKLTLANSEAS
ncbi:MAG: BadF/BadG/BcrA/BcrD ATPase family protein [Phototrophicaceae bacterium]